MEVELIFLMSSAEQMKFEWQLFALFGVIPGAFLFRAYKLGQWKKVRTISAIYGSIYLYLFLGRIMFAYEIYDPNNLKPFVYGDDKFFKLKKLDYDTGNWILVGALSGIEVEVDMQSGLFCQTFLSFIKSSDLKLSEVEGLLYSIEVNKNSNLPKFESNAVLEICPKKIFIYKAKLQGDGLKRNIETTNK